MITFTFFDCGKYSPTGATLTWDRPYAYSNQWLLLDSFSNQSSSIACILGEGLGTGILLQDFSDSKTLPGGSYFTVLKKKVISSGGLLDVAKKDGRMSYIPI